jgi:hypothetical protein
MPKIITLSDTLKESIQLNLRNLSNALGPPIKVTLVIRHQGDDNCFAVFSEDPHLEKVIETIQKNIKMNAPKLEFAKQVSNDETP